MMLRFSRHVLNVFRHLLVLGSMLPLIARAQANLTVSADQTIRAIDERFFGVNAVMWDGQTSAAQTITLLQASGVRVIRLPGGSASDIYHWSKNTTANNTWTWAAGFDSFSRLVAGLGSQAFVTVNYGTGTAEEAAAWVAYANASSTLLGTSSDVALGVDANGVDWKTAGYWSQLRASTPLGTDDGRNFLRVNRSSAYGMKYWEIGNECYGSWEDDSHPVQWDPVTYANFTQAYLAKMKSVDPTIKVGVVAQKGEDSLDAKSPVHKVTNPRTGVDHHGWTPVMLTTLKSLAVTPDFLIYHRYDQAPGAESDAVLLQASKTWPVDATDLRQQLTDYLGSNGAKVEMVVTENNSVYGDPGKQSTSLVNALFMADSFGNIIQTEFNALVWWDLRNGQDNTKNNSSALYGWRNYGDYGIISTQSSFGSATNFEPYPTYYVQKLLARFARADYAVVKATSSSPLLSIFATRPDSHSVNLLVINKDPLNTLNANITVTDYAPVGYPLQKTADVYSYGIPQDNAAKPGAGGSTDIATTSLAIPGDTFPASFAPYSATVISLTVGPPTPIVSPPVTPVTPVTAPTSSGGGGGGSTGIYFLGALAALVTIRWWQRG